jgi:hypothetical protein
MEKGARAMSEPYVLKTIVGINTLSHLNDHQKNIMGRLKGALECFSTNEPEEIVDIVHAVFSGNKIVNPMSPEEEFRKKRAELIGSDLDIVGEFVDPLVEIIAKEHPDVKDWLGDQDA